MGPKSNRENEWEEISKEVMREIDPGVKHIDFQDEKTTESLHKS